MPAVEVDRDLKVLNDVLDELGVGKYQILSFTIISIVAFISIINQHTFIFTARDTIYRCAIPECEDNFVKYEESWLNVTIPFTEDTPYKCERYAVSNNTDNNITDINGEKQCDASMFDNKTIERCTEWIYKGGDSIIKEFGLACQEWRSSLIGTVNGAGLLVSLFFTGFISDKYGRRNSLMVIVVLGGLFGVAQSFTSSYWVFFVLEFLTMAVGSGGYSIAYVLGAEILPAMKRIYGCAFLEIVSSLAMATIGLYAWALESWRSVLRVANIPLLTIPFLILLIPESLRWLYANGKKSECVKILKKAAEMNGGKLSSDILLEMDSFATKEPSKITDTSIAFFEVIKSPILLVRLLLCSYCFFASFTLYNGLALNSVTSDVSHNDVYLDYTLVSLADLPVMLIYPFILGLVKRKISLCSTYVITAVLCFAYAVLPSWNPTADFVLYLFCKASANTCYLIIFIFVSEIFPTVARNSSLNFCYIFGSIGAMVTPQILLLHTFHKALPMVAYGAISLLAGIAVLQCPESRGKNLPDTIKEAEEF